MNKRTLLKTLLRTGIILLLSAIFLRYQPLTSAGIQPDTIDPNTAATSTTPWYPVTKVVDGDTIKIDMGGKETTIRLIGVDTPETVDPRKPVQCFGKEASDKTKQILTGQSVHIETDPSQGLLDKYGRTLAYVYAPLNVDPAGLLVNKYLIAEGYGHEYTYNLPYKYQADFKVAETAARTQKKGLWADGVCVNGSTTNSK